MGDTMTSQTFAGVQDTSTGSMPPKVLLERRGAMRLFTLNRPKTLNAFDDDMRKIIADEIPRVARDPDTYVVGFQSASPKAFSAGCDIRALIATAQRDMEEAKSYFRAEYSLNWLLDFFSKPTVSFIDGICMGSGAGLSCYNTHRVAGERYQFAMPETAIGLFPDVGVAHVLASLPWPMGLFLGLTGRSTQRADAAWLGLVTHCIDAARFPAIIDQLADAQPIDPLLDSLNIDCSPGPLQRDAAMIEDLFSATTLPDILRRLQGASGVSALFANSVLDELKQKSPLSLLITDRHIRSARKMDLRDTLIQDYRLAVRCLAGHDFGEGVRAMIIDKDKDPHWSPARLEDVTAEHVDQYFMPVETGDLILPSRSEMQAARV